MVPRQRDKIARTETARLTQMYDGSYQDMQRSNPEKFYQDKLGKFRESEHQKVSSSPDDDYAQVENNFTPYDYVPYNPTPFPANGKPQARKPGKKQGEAEFYNCWIQGHCCDNTKGGPIKLYCTYAFDGPYKKPGILQTRTGEPWVRNRPDPTIANMCAKEVTGTDSCKNEFDDLWCMVHGPTQNIEVQVLNLVTETSDCSSTTLCSQPSCTPAITSTTTQLNVGESTQLVATNTCPEKSYYFKLISGGGKVTKNGLYTAPATNPGCVSNPNIALVCDCQTVATKSLAINSYVGDLTVPAYRVFGPVQKFGHGAGNYPACDVISCGATPGFSIWTNKTRKAYNCAGSEIENTICSGASTGCCGSMCSNCATVFASFPTDPIADCATAGDLRTPAMLAAGCCPSQLL